MKDRLVHIDITDDGSLLEVCDILHDAQCDLSTLEYKEQADTLKIIFKRHFEEPSLMTREPKFLFFEKIIFPLTLSKLSLKGVKDFKVEDKSNISIYTFNECEIKGDDYHFLFCEDMKMVIRFEGAPSGSLFDEKLLDEKGVVYSLRNPFSKGN